MIDLVAFTLFVRSLTPWPWEKIHPALAHREWIALAPTERRQWVHEAALILEAWAE